MWVRSNRTLSTIMLHTAKIKTFSVKKTKPGGGYVGFDSLMQHDKLTNSNYLNNRICKQLLTDIFLITRWYYLFRGI